MNPIPPMPSLETRGRKSPSGGFTLIELLLALAILALVAGGIYSTLSATMSATAEAHVQQVRGRQAEALGEFLREGFANLPPRSRLLLRTREVRGVQVRDLILSDAPGGFASGGKAFAGCVGLMSEPRGDGLFNLMLSRMSGEFPQSLDALDGTTLVTGLRMLDWSVMAPGRKEWSPQWWGVELPLLVRCRWQLQGEDTVTERVFDVPASRVKIVEPETPANGNS